jgi:CheY-like chemotaxis protein
MKPTILVVDDDPAVRHMLCRLLDEENYKVIAAASGPEALQTASRNGPQLVLLDLNLPGKNGWDTFEQMSQEIPLTPVIIITARPNQLFPALASGVGALMEKPLDLPRLLHTIAELLAEPEAARLARIAGRRAEFHYVPPMGLEPKGPANDRDDE